MSLNEQLSAIKSKSSPPPEAAAIMKRVKSELADSGLVDKAPKVGDKAPEFTLPNIYGDTLSSTRLLTQGPLVLHFYRGGW